jgi:hypothetical protein
MWLCKKNLLLFYHYFYKYSKPHKILAWWVKENISTPSIKFSFEKIMTIILDHKSPVKLTMFVSWARSEVFCLGLGQTCCYLGAESIPGDPHRTGPAHLMPFFFTSESVRVPSSRVHPSPNGRRGREGGQRWRWWQSRGGTGNGA